MRTLGDRVSVRSLESPPSTGRFTQSTGEPFDNWNLQGLDSKQNLSLPLGGKLLLAKCLTACEGVSMM
jgi:hypothetical protein